MADPATSQTAKTSDTLTPASFGIRALGESEKSPEPAPEAAEPSAEAELAQALQADDNPPEKDSQAGIEADPPETPKDLAALAEKLGVEVKDLYAVEFPMQSGENRTIGDLKDMLAGESEFQARTLEFEETRTRQENEMLRAKQDLQVIMQALPKEAIRQDILDKAHAAAAKHREHESARLLEVIPAWVDETIQDDDRAGMVEHLEQYGFDQSHLDGVHDHRMVKYIRDNWAREKRVKAAMEKYKVTTTKTRTQKASAHAPERQPTPQRVDRSRDKTSSQVRTSLAQSFRG